MLKISWNRQSSKAMTQSDRWVHWTTQWCPRLNRSRSSNHWIYSSRPAYTSQGHQRVVIRGLNCLILVNAKRYSMLASLSIASASLKLSASSTWSRCVTVWPRHSWNILILGRDSTFYRISRTILTRCHKATRKSCSRIQPSLGIPTASIMTSLNSHTTSGNYLYISLNVKINHLSNLNRILTR